MEKWEKLEITKAQYIIDMIENTIPVVCENWGIDDLKNEGQRVWKAVLQETGERLFRDGELKGILRDKALYKSDNDLMMSNSNRFDYDLLDVLCDYYLKLSDRYKKLTSIVAYSRLFNISETTIELWANYENDIDINIYNNINNNDVVIDNRELLTYKAFKIYKKIKQGRLDCVLDKGYDSNNVMGTMYIGNSEFGLNLPGVREVRSSGRQLVQRETVQEIAENSPVSLPKID